MKMLIRILIFCCISTFNNNLLLSKLKNIKTIQIEENYEVIYSNISYLELKNDTILISDNKSNIVAMHNSKDGSLIKRFYFNNNLLDGLNNKNGIFREGYSYISADTMFSKYPGIRKLPTKIGISPHQAKFYNNNILVFANFNPISIQINAIDTNMNIGNINGVVKLNMTSKQMSVYAFMPDDKNNYPLNYSNILILNDKFISSCWNSKNLKNNNFDSLSCLCQIDENGIFEKVIATLPKEQVKSGLEYSWFGYPITFLNNKQEIIIAFPALQKIYNLTTNDTIDLVNLQYDNYKYINEMIDGELTPMEQYNKNIGFLPNIIGNIFQDNSGNYYVTIYLRILDSTTEEVKYQIQKYDKNWNFIDEIFLPIEDNAGKQILRTEYSVDEDLFLFVLKDSEHFYISFRRWE